MVFVDLPNNRIVSSLFYLPVKWKATRLEKLCKINVYSTSKMSLCSAMSVIEKEEEKNSVDKLFSKWDDNAT